MAARSLAVSGMTCDHCASAVRAEISKLPGIVEVDVDVAAGIVRISGDPLPGDLPLREAIEEAGRRGAAPGDVPDDIVAAVPELSVRPTLT